MTALKGSGGTSHVTTITSVEIQSSNGKAKVPHSKYMQQDCSAAFVKALKSFSINLFRGGKFKVCCC